mgnify:FL=1
MPGNRVLECSYRFALRTVALGRELRKQRELELAGQLLRSGTSIGANVEEAQAGFSRREFAAKMGIAAKEARESLYWLRLIRDSGTRSGVDIDSMIEDATELVRLLTAIVHTASKP